MNYAAENKKTVSGNFMFVAILLMFAYLCMRSCQTATVQNATLNKVVSAKNDTIKSAHRNIDSIVHIKQEVSDVATKLANSNEILKDSITTIQQTSDITDVKTEIKVNDDVEHLKTDVQLLAAQRDSLIELNRQLSALSASYRQDIAKETVAKTDSLKTKAKPVTAFSPYIIGMRDNELTKPPKFQVNLAAQAGYNFSLHSATTGLGMSFFFGHSRIYTGAYYNWNSRDIRSNISLNQDLFNVYKSKK